MSVNIVGTDVKIVLDEEPWFWVELIGEDGPVVLRMKRPLLAKMAHRVSQQFAINIEGLPSK